MTTYRALQAVLNPDGTYGQLVATLPLSQLPPHPVRVRVHWSALNYKDALSASGHRGVTRNYPHTPGIDAAGIVESSEDERFKPGDQVIVTSHDLGMNTPGGLAEYIQVPGDWVVPLPEQLSLKDSMILGTAGITAALALHKLLRNGLAPEQGPVVVSGASGGVGSVAIMLLAQLGYTVWAVSGSQEAYDWLTELGAERCLPRTEVSDNSSRPLLKSRWAGAIDTVGGEMLAGLLKACSKEGSVAACGLVASAEFPATVYPFILNGVNLLGVDSAEFSASLRQELWQRLGSDWKIDGLDKLATELSLEQVPEALNKMLRGGTRGRQIVSLA